LPITDKEKAELYLAHAISTERIAKWLVEKGIASQEDSNETLARMYENLHEREKEIEAFRVSPGYAEIMRTYLKKALLNQYLSLTDIAREKDKASPSYVIQSWLRSRNTLEFLRIWETANNSDFDEYECEALLEAMKLPSFTVTPKQWITRTRAIGLVSKQGKNGGTLAHPDIAMDFHMWMEPELRMNLIEMLRKSNIELDGKTDGRAEM
jgi:hypothetical protein